ncbi:MAG TPA: hypothetical protein ENN29_09720 [Candidatus Hydrogenedentes bacterium]|nr:hypothetical protein [Candidatus Hydrogenedentota bacterium]
MSRPHVHWWAIATIIATTASAADQPVILNVGEASVFVNPGVVEFTFIRHFSGDTLQSAIEQFDAFIQAAPTAVRGSELQPTEILTAPPIITSMEQRQVKASFRVRFSMAVFNTAKTGPAQFAALCDKLAALADTMKCTLAPFELFAPDPDSVIAAAVTRATENAYPPAEAVATAVKTNIYAVDRVEVLEVEWEQRPAGQTAEVPQLACKAKVQVTYALAPQ